MGGSYGSTPTYGGKPVSPAEAGTMASESVKKGSSGGSGGSGGGGGGSGGGGGGCFPRGTCISTPTGYRDIALVQVGDHICSVVTSTGDIVARRVLKIASHSDRNIWRLRFDDGTTLRTTSVHTFRVGENWTVASKIKVGDRLSDLGAHSSIATKVVSESCNAHEVDDVYNLIVEGENNFIADNVLVHSFTRLRVLRGLLWNCLANIQRTFDRPASIEVA